MSEEFSTDSLKRSVARIGQLYPNLVNQDGKVLDGNHRIGAGATEKKLVETKNRFEELLVRAHAHHRRRVPQEETRALVEEMATALETTGTPKDEICKVIIESLPYAPEYSRSLVPSVYKDQVKADAAAKGAKISLQTQDTVEAEPKLQKPTITPIQSAINPDDFILCAGCMSKVHKDRAVPLSKDDPEHFVHPTEHCRDLARERLKHISKPSAQKEEKPREFNLDDWPTREQRMHEKHPEMEQWFGEALSPYRDLVGPQCGPRVLAVMEIESDNYFPKLEAYPFLDGEEVHAKRHDKDEYLRQFYMKHHPEAKLITLPYDKKTREEAKRLAWAFMEKIGVAEQARELDKKNGEKVKP